MLAGKFLCNDIYRDDTVTEEDNNNSNCIATNEKVMEPLDLSKEPLGLGSSKKQFFGSLSG